MGSNKILVAIFVCISLCMVNAQTDISNFAPAKMANYANWTLANNLDPSPLVAGPSSFRASNAFTTLDCTLSNHGVKGHSGEMEVNSWGMLELEYFLMVTNSSGTNVTFFGDYKCNGTVVDGGDISGEGTFSIQVHDLYLNYLIVGFAEEPSGYLSVPTYVLPKPELYRSEADEINFENLLENESAIGHEEDIRSALFKGFEDYLSDDEGEGLDHPIRTLYLKFFEEVLAESTIKDLTRAK